MSAMYELFKEYESKHFKDLFDTVSQGLTIKEMFEMDMKEKVARYIKNDNTSIEDATKVLTSYMMYFNYVGSIEGYETHQREIERGK